MKRSTRSSTVVAAVALVAATSLLTSCSSSAPSDTVITPTAPTEPVTLSLEVFSNIQTPAFTAAIDAFEAEYPTVTVEVTALAQDQYYATVRTALAAGSGPDVLFTPGGTGNSLAVGDLAEAGLIEDLSNQAWASRLTDAAKAVAGPDGAVYMWPNGANAIDAMYQPSVLSAQGLDVPTTWDEVLSYCSDASAAGLVPFAWGAQDQTSAQMYLYGLLSSLVYGPDPDFNAKVESGETTLTDSEGWKSALTQLQTMSTNGCFNQSPVGTSFASSLGMFASGSAGAMVWINALAASLEAQNPSAEIASFALPATDDADGTYVPLTIGGFAVNAQSANKNAAELLLDYLSQPETAKAYFEGTDTLSTLTDVTPTLSANQSSVQELVDAGRASTLPFWSNSETQTAMIAGIQSMIAGTATPSDVLGQMQATITVG